MDLTQRKMKILEIVVDNYIKNPSPISSKYIMENHLPDVSSATIRAELNFLESMGYLVQPHTSAGRIPSAKAYQLYVNNLMVKRGLGASEVNYIQNYLANQITNVESVVKSAARLITEMTNYTSIAIPSNFTYEKIQAVKLIKISDSNAVVIVVTDSNTIKDSVLTIKEEVNDEYITLATNILNKLFMGKTFNEAVLVEKELENIFDRFNIMLRQVIALLKSCMLEDIYVTGSSKIFEYPEYKDFDNARRLLSIIDNKSVLVDLLKKSKPDFQVSITIGSEENQISGLPAGCSIVSANYFLNGIDIGSAGVLGPMRMEYDKVISVLEVIAKTIKTILDD